MAVPGILNPHEIAEEMQDWIDHDLQPIFLSHPKEKCFAVGTIVSLLRHPYHYRIHHHFYIARTYY